MSIEGRVVRVERRRASGEGSGRVRHGILIGFGALGGAVAWSLHLLVIYGLLPVACALGTGLVIHAATALLGGVTAGAMVVSLRAWRRRDVGPAERWLGAAGLLLNGLFLFAIVVEGLPAFVLGPCQ